MRKGFFSRLVNAFSSIFRRRVIKKEIKPKKPERKEPKKILKRKLEKKPKRLKKFRRAIKKIKSRKEPASPSVKLTTQIDELMDIVSTKKGVSIDELAKRFGQEPEKIEEWGRLLQEQGMVELVYPENPFQKPFLRRVHEKQE